MATIKGRWSLWALLLLVVPACYCSHVPLDEYAYFFEYNEAPPNSELEWPEFLSGKVTMELRPLIQEFDTIEQVHFVRSIKSFYTAIFDSQSEYNLAVRSVEVYNQTVRNAEEELEVEILVAVNFRKENDSQELTDEQFLNILYNLANRFDVELLEHLQSGHTTFAAIESVFARRQDPFLAPLSQSSDKSNLWPIIGAVVGLMVMIVALAAAYHVYRKELSMPNSIHWIKTRNISPFRAQDEDEEVFSLQMEVATDTTIDAAEDDMMTLKKSNKYSFRPSDVPDLLDTPTSPQSPPKVTQSRLTEIEATSKPVPSRLSLDTSTGDKPMDEPDKVLPPGNKREIWAPSGKLGVAMDVVEGRPVVHSLKRGSPLEGFLQSGDWIVGLDEINTVRMSAAEITSLMVRRMDSRRKIIYVRPFTNVGLVEGTGELI
mmetsp:Transcript_38106/g.56713  ORF Transcript_38106/g.56713 Transcript_38106/m.56713 type:complete len:431 (-) Transcript_38106:75-1367(-)